MTVSPRTIVDSASGHRLLVERRIGGTDVVVEPSEALGLVVAAQEAELAFGYGPELEFTLSRAGV